MNCKTCDLLIEKKNSYPICIFLSNFIRDTYWAPDGEFFINDIDKFGCNQWQERNYEIKQYIVKFNKIIKEIKYDSGIFMPCTEKESARIIRAIDSIKYKSKKYYIGFIKNRDNKCGINITRKDIYYSNR